MGRAGLKCDGKEVRELFFHIGGCAKRLSSCSGSGLSVLAAPALRHEIELRQLVCRQLSTKVWWPAEGVREREREGRCEQKRDGKTR